MIPSHPWVVRHKALASSEYSVGSPTPAGVGQLPPVRLTFVGDCQVSSLLSHSSAVEHMEVGDGGFERRSQSTHRDGGAHFLTRPVSPTQATP